MEPSTTHQAFFRRGTQLAGGEEVAPRPSINANHLARIKHEKFEQRVSALYDLVENILTDPPLATSEDDTRIDEALRELDASLAQWTPGTMVELTLLIIHAIKNAIDTSIAHRAAPTPASTP